MGLEDYRDVWQEQGDGPPDPDEEELVDRVRERFEAFERRIRRRDRLETITGLAVVAFFGYSLAAASSWVAKAGAAIVIAAAGFIVQRLRRARNRDERPEPGAPVTEHLRAARDQVATQIELLESVLWWYLAPLAAGGVLYVVGLGTGMLATLITLGTIAAVCGVIWWLNQRAVRRELRPRHEQLTRMIRELEKGREG